MIISQELMDQIHCAQVEMLKELIEVLNTLNLDYFFVHGSLLGAVRLNDFVPEDDDIDIALRREDYDQLMAKGPGKLCSSLYLQHSLSDGYPLPFAKLRNSNTTFFQPILRRYRCNQGIYIDIFPIDNALSTFDRIKLKILNFRIYSKMSFEKKKTFKIIIGKILLFLSYLIFPSYNRALIIRERLLREAKQSHFVTLSGGKISEQKIPKDIFQAAEKVRFRDIYVSIPKDYGKYLSIIYGSDYMNINPAENRIDTNGISVSASYINLHEPFSSYLSNVTDDKIK